jgi:hypothetical protein
MSSSSVALYEQHKARDKFVRYHEKLRLCLAMGDAYRHLDPLVEACEDWLARCGDNVLTDKLRESFERTKRVVECRHVLLSKEKAND